MSNLASGESVRMPAPRYGVRNLPMSSRENPKVIWVRSFVPKLKKSACLAMSLASRAARGSSIMVPIL